MVNLQRNIYRRNKATFETNSKAIKIIKMLILNRFSIKMWAITIIDRTKYMCPAVQHQHFQYWLCHMYISPFVQVQSELSCNHGN